MMNKDKPRTENAFEKSNRLRIRYKEIAKGPAMEEQIAYHWDLERSMAKQIIDILYNDVWDKLPPGLQTAIFYQTQTYLKKHFDNVEVPAGKCLDVYGRVSDITLDWRPETNNTISVES